MNSRAAALPSRPTPRKSLTVGPVGQHAGGVAEQGVHEAVKRDDGRRRPDAAELEIGRDQQVERHQHAAVNVREGVQGRADNERQVASGGRRRGNGRQNWHRARTSEREGRGNGSAGGRGDVAGGYRVGRGSPRPRVRWAARGLGRAVVAKLASYSDSSLRRLLWRNRSELKTMPSGRRRCRRLRRFAPRVRRWRPRPHGKGLAGVEAVVRDKGLGPLSDPRPRQQCLVPPRHAQRPPSTVGAMNGGRRHHACRARGRTHTPWDTRAGGARRE